ncbi:MAG: DUF1800 family protein, partial [Blastocatellia bacterium]
MKKQTLRELTKLNGMTRRIVRVVLLTAVTLSMVVGAMIPAGASGANKNKSRKAASGLETDQKIAHLLDRITFGARPGDIAQVKRMGIDRYIDLQLHPDRIDESALQAKLRMLPSLHMDIQEAYQQYPNPMLIARQLGIRPAANGAAARKPQRNQNPNAVDGQSQGSGVLPPGEDAGTGNQQASQQPNGQGNPQGNAQGNAQADPAAARLQKENREMIRDYYIEHNLRQPQMLLSELQAEKIISAVYSERQLQQVLSDFWFNHFNIYWPKGADRWMTTDYVMNAIQPHALGKFKDLLMATAKSPAMLFYLDNAESSVPGAKPPAPGRGLARRAGPFGPFYRRPFPP